MKALPRTGKLYKLHIS